MSGKGQAQSSPVSAFAGLPEELSEFLSKDTYSLLIKGDSGTGKTILALTILRSLRPLENPLYLSTRTSPLQLVENYPWVEEIFGPPNAVGVGRGRDTEGWDTIVDARLDEPNIVFERITNVLMDRQAPIVVIDSWESLSDALGSEALRTNIKVLQTWRERAGAKFIFVGEDPANTAIDYMVEGVVVLKDRVEEGRRLREVVLSKLHGVKITKPSYFFTLQGGMFSSFPSYSLRDYEFRAPIPVRFERPFKRGTRIPTGYDPLDDVLDGGLPPRSTVSLELDRSVDAKAALILLSRVVQDWTSSGGKVVMERPDGVDRRYLRQYTRSFAAGRGKVELEGEHKARLEGRAKAGKTLVILGGGELRAESVRTTPQLVLKISREKADDGRGRPAVSLKLEEIEGTLFLECLLPSPALFGVIPVTSGGNPLMRIEPVV